MFHTRPYQQPQQVSKVRNLWLIGFSVGKGNRQNSAVSLRQGVALKEFFLGVRVEREKEKKKKMLGIQKLKKRKQFLFFKE